MGLHYAATFRYSEYQDEIRPFVEQVDRGNFEPLRQAVIEAIPQIIKGYPLQPGWSDRNGVPISVQTWSLFEHGIYEPPPIQEIEDLKIPSNYELGEWFLYIAGKYTTPCTSLYVTWGVLYKELLDAGWSAADWDLLLLGISTYKLLKPHLIAKQPKFLDRTTPYFFCVQGGRGRSGWLPLYEIERLYRLLAATKFDVESFDVRLVPHIERYNPNIFGPLDQFASKVYQSAFDMLSAAIDAKQGLFMSITLP